MENIYKRHRFRPSIIQHAVGLYYHSNLSIREVADLLAERNISGSYEVIRLWINKFVLSLPNGDTHQYRRGQH